MPCIQSACSFMCSRAHWCTCMHLRASACALPQCNGDAFITSMRFVSVVPADDYRGRHGSSRARSLQDRIRKTVSRGTWRAGMHARNALAPSARRSQRGGAGSGRVGGAWLSSCAAILGPPAHPPVHGTERGRARCRSPLVGGSGYGLARGAGHRSRCGDWRAARPSAGEGSQGGNRNAFVKAVHASEAPPSAASLALRRPTVVSLSCRIIRGTGNPATRHRPALVRARFSRPTPALLHQRTRC